MSGHEDISRRQFVSMAAAAGIAGQPVRGAGPAPVKDPVQRKAQPFPLKQVRLLEGPFRLAMERNRQFLHELEADRLLHTFRIAAGLPSSAQPLGGWERPNVELRGHFTGHYLSACALMHAAAGDEALKARGGAMVAELAKCQKANGGGYLSAFPPEFFERLKDGKRVWAPWYTLHKIMAGLLDLHHYCGNDQALEVLEGMAGWTKRWADPLSDEHMARVLNVEFGGMNEVLYNLYATTGNREYLELAHRFDHERVFAPLAERRDALRGLHANTNIPKVTGAARRYELTGELRYREIAEFFWRQIVEHRAYCTGGTSNHEHWRTDPDRLAGELSSETQECCCTYNMLKLTRRLFCWTAGAGYTDYYERALFNGILGTMHPENAMTMYFVPLASGYWKMFSAPRDSFWCCTGTGVESFSKLADSIYFHDEQGIYVNLFIASALEWPEKGLRIRQETGFPEQQGTTLMVEAKRPLHLALRIRAPYWATRGIGAKLNGKALKNSAGPGSYLTLTRTWKSGDKLEVSLPMSLHVHAMPDDDSLQAFMYGPLVLAGQLGTSGLTKEMMYSDPKHQQQLQGSPVPAPDFTAVSKDPNAWVKPVAGQPLTFRTTGQTQDLTLVAFNRLFDQRYAVYWRVLSTVMAQKA
jgi:DUF1680 family protein